MTSTGRVHGFPYAHLLHFSLEKNPSAALASNEPVDRFTFFFSTHEVRLLGWRLFELIPHLRKAELVSVIAVEARYYGLSGSAPFICNIEVIPNDR